MIALITGGSGCGKSTYAEKLIASTPPGGRLYIATMQVYDEESQKRVARLWNISVGAGSAGIFGAWRKVLFVGACAHQNKRDEPCVLRGRHGADQQIHFP